MQGGKGMQPDGMQPNRGGKPQANFQIRGGRKMYILKNSLVSIMRNKGRNILIGIIILVIACASTVDVVYELKK